MSIRCLLSTLSICDLVCLQVSLIQSHSPNFRRWIASLSEVSLAETGTAWQKRFKNPIPRQSFPLVNLVFLHNPAEIFWFCVSRNVFPSPVQWLMTYVTYSSVAPSLVRKSQLGETTPVFMQFWLLFYQNTQYCILMFLI